MKRVFTDIIDKVGVEFVVVVTPKDKKAKKASITEFAVAGSATIGGKTHTDLHTQTYYDKETLVEQLPHFESCLWDKAAVLVRTPTETVDDKLKKMGYE